MKALLKTVLVFLLGAFASGPDAMPREDGFTESGFAAGGPLSSATG